MSERVSNQLARAVADGHDAAAVGRIELALDLLDSRARVEELEEALDIAVCGIDEGSALRLKFERALRGEER
jgi:hypothetical protein